MYFDEVCLLFHFNIVQFGLAVTQHCITRQLILRQQSHGNEKNVKTIRMQWVKNFKREGRGTLVHQPGIV